MWFQDFVTVFNQSYNCQTSHYLGRNRPPNARLSILLFDPCIQQLYWHFICIFWFINENENSFNKDQSKQQISWGKTSGFVDSEFVKTCDEFVNSPKATSSSFTEDILSFNEVSENFSEAFQVQTLKLLLALVMLEQVVVHHSSSTGNVEKILKGSLDSIPSPSPSVKIQIMGGKVCLRCKGKTLLGVVNKLLKTKSLLTSPSNVLPY